MTKKKSEVFVPVYAVPEQVRIELQRKLDTCDIGFIRNGRYTLTVAIEDYEAGTVEYWKGRIRVCDYRELEHPSWINLDIYREDN